MPTELKTPTEQPKAASKTFTNWDAFAKAGLRPVTITCQAYAPYHRVDRSCHSNLRFKPEDFKRHMPGCGGALQLTLKKVDGKESALWKELSESGLEAHDFRCDICDKQLAFRPSSILPCLRAHSGKTRRVHPGGKFNITLGEVREQDEELSDDAA